MYAIELEHVKKTFRKSGFTLDLPELRVPEGYVTGFIGENGAGKTTTMKLIMHMLFVGEGAVRVLGRDVSEASLRADIGYVGENMGFMDEATLDANVRMLKPFYPQWDDREFNALLRRFGLTDLRQKHKALSQGKRKQFALATVLARRPRLLLLDEPTANLDPLVRNEILTILSEKLEREELTVFFSTHITSDLDKIADYLQFIHKGRLLLSGAKDEILESHQVVKGKRDLLAPETRDVLVHCEETEFGFSGLCGNIAAAREVFGGEAVYEKATVEDIFIAYTKRERGISV